MIIKDEYQTLLLSLGGEMEVWQFEKKMRKKLNIFGFEYVILRPSEKNMVNYVSNVIVIKIFWFIFNGVNGKITNLFFL